jgi:NitT/TauT family transport system ATP-binding protein
MSVEVAGIRKVYEGGVEALRDVSIAFPPGKLSTLLGPSGCGKTTLLKIIAGLIPHDAGEVRVKGERVRGPGPERALVFQDFALLPWASVLRNVAFGLELRGVPRAERNAVVERVVELVGLGAWIDKYPSELSGGMQQRVGVVRALANEPDVLLMDEPFASVDAQTRMTLQEELTRIWEERRPTVIFITHDVNEAVFLANRVVVLSKGKVLEEVRVDLPRPRYWDALMEDDGFKATSGRVLQLVRSA